MTMSDPTPTCQPMILCFTSLKVLLRQPLDGGTVYLDCVRKVAGGPGAISDAVSRVVVQARQGPLILSYSRVVGRATLVHGEAMGPGPEVEEARRRIGSALDCIQAVLADAGYRVVEASFALPRDYLIVDGTSDDFMTYDPESGVFTPRSEPAVD